MAEIFRHPIVTANKNRVTCHSTTKCQSQERIKEEGDANHLIPAHIIMRFWSLVQIFRKLADIFLLWKHGSKQF